MTDPADAAQRALGLAGMKQQARAIEALRAVDRVRALHQPYRSVYDQGDARSCAHCNQLTSYAVPYPCDTIRALDGNL